MVAITSKTKADEKKSLKLKNILVRVWVVWRGRRGSEREVVGLLQQMRRDLYFTRSQVAVLRNCRTIGR